MGLSDNQLLANEELMMLCSGVIKKVLGERNGYILLAFPLNGNDDDLANYISNANREDAIRTLETLVKVLKEKEGC